MDRTLSKTVYRKPTHNDQDLHWDSHHNLSAKYTAFNTQTHSARTVWSSRLLLQKEEEHMKGSLKRCKYPDWALNRIKIKNCRHKTNVNQLTNKRGNIHMMVPNTKGVSESVEKICRNMGYKHISREAIPSRTSWLPPRAETQPN